MKTSEAKIGRIFVVRLEDGDRLPQAIESWAEEKGLDRGICFLIGGIRGGGKVVAGPEEPDLSPVIPLVHSLSGVHEILGIGTIFPGEDGRPALHMHASLGRNGESRTGCIRPGIDTWKVGELLVLELTWNQASRQKDTATGFELLELPRTK